MPTKVTSNIISPPNCISVEDHLDITSNQLFSGDRLKKTETSGEIDYEAHDEETSLENDKKLK